MFLSGSAPLHVNKCYEIYYSGAKHRYHFLGEHVQWPGLNLGFLGIRLDIVHKVDGIFDETKCPSSFMLPYIHIISWGRNAVCKYV